MRIVHIISTLGVGGAEKLLVNVANMLSEKHEVIVIYFKIDTLVNDFNDKIKVIHIPINPRIVINLRREFIKLKPDVIHTHLTHADLFGLLAAKYLNGVKTISTIHNTKYKHNFLDNFYYLLYIFLFNVISRKTKVIAISKLLISLIHKKLFVQKNRIHFLYNTLSENKRQINVQIPINLRSSQNKFKILFVGRLSKQKAVHNLIDAISFLPDQIVKNINVFLVGQGDLEVPLKSRASNLGLSDIIFFEGLSNQVSTYMEKCQIFVLPSIFEGLPLVLVEALKSGIPIISANIEGPAELITDYYNGILFKKNDSKDLAKKIENLYFNENLRAEISKNGKMFFEKNFTPENYIKNLAYIYKNL